MFLDHFDALISKIIFFKIKIHYFNVFSSKKHFKKQSQSHNYQIFYTCFLLHINFKNNFYQTRVLIQLTLANHTFFKFIFLKLQL
jgi:hypothetical protein